MGFRGPFRFRVDYVSENTSAHNAHQRRPTTHAQTHTCCEHVKKTAESRRQKNSEAHYDGTF
jgi:hypothetical protein